MAQLAAAASGGAGQGPFGAAPAMGAAFNPIKPLAMKRAMSGTTSVLELLEAMGARLTPNSRLLQALPPALFIKKVDHRWLMLTRQMKLGRWDLSTGAGTRAISVASRTPRAGRQRQIRLHPKPCPRERPRSFPLSSCISKSLIQLLIFDGLDPADRFQRRERRPHRQSGSHPCAGSPVAPWRKCLLLRDKSKSSYTL